MEKHIFMITINKPSGQSTTWNRIQRGAWPRRTIRRCFCTGLRSEGCVWRQRELTVRSVVPEQHEETAGPPTDPPEPTPQHQHMQNLLHVSVTAELELIDENNVVEMQTNYTSYRKIPLHWFHQPRDGGVTKDYEFISQHVHHSTSSCKPKNSSLLLL